MVFHKLHQIKLIFAQINDYNAHIAFKINSKISRPINVEIIIIIKLDFHCTFILRVFVFIHEYINYTNWNFKIILMYIIVERKFNSVKLKNLYIR